MANMPGSIEFEKPSEQNRQFSGKVKINSILVKVFQGQTCIQSDAVNQLDWPEGTVQESCKDFFEDEYANETSLPEEENDLELEAGQNSEASVKVNHVNVDVIQSDAVNQLDWTEGTVQESCKDFLKDEYADETSLPEEENNLELEAGQLSEASVKVNHVNVDVIQCPVPERQAESSGQGNCQKEFQAGESSLAEQEKIFVQERNELTLTCPNNKINHVSICVDQYPGRLYQELFTSPAPSWKDPDKQLKQVAVPSDIFPEDSLSCPGEIMQSSGLKQKTTGEDVSVETGEGKIKQPFPEHLGCDDPAGGDESDSSRLFVGKDMNLPEGITSTESAESFDIEGQGDKMDKDTMKMVIELIRAIKSGESKITHPGLDQSLVCEENPGGEELDTAELISENDLYLPEETTDQEVTSTEVAGLDNRSKDEIIDNDTMKMVVDLIDVIQAGESKNLQPDSGLIIAGESGRPQLRLQSIIISLFFIVGLIFLRLKHNASS